jgi:hypothetical protein
MNVDFDRLHHLKDALRLGARSRGMNSKAVRLNPRRLAPTLAIALVPLLLASCGGREFRTEADAIKHFKEHREGFARAAQLFLSLNTAAIAIPKEATAASDGPIVPLARELRVYRIAARGSKSPTDEQWIQFYLAQGPSESSYGLIFVPEGRERALKIARAEVDSPSPGVRFIHLIEGRWFYFDYD